MKRRTFLSGMVGLGLGSAGLKSWAAAMDHAAMGMAMKQGEASLSLLPETALAGGALLQDLPRLRNESQQPGYFKATLQASAHGIALVAGQRETVFWAYNRSIPGPMIEVYEGDTVEIAFENHLSQPSSIHWHGLPVPPDQDGSPQQAVPAGGRHVYRFELPLGSAGTYWYHPHPHHYTAEQAFRGLAGALIVRARHDPLAGIPERLLLVSDLKLDQQAAIAPNDNNDWMNGREGQFVLVNGQKQPQLVFDAGGRERWRVWNACSARYLRLQLPGSTFTLVGTDGGLIAQPQQGLTEYLLAPGQRAELIVDAAGRHDRVELMAAIYPRGKMGRVAPERAISLLTVNFAKTKAGALPTLPAVLRPIADLGQPMARKRVVFSEEMSMEGGQHHMRFLVNGHEFDMNRIDLTSKVNEVELWELVNEADMDHPFHLHGTQFQVVERVVDGVTTPEPLLAWHDTVNLRAGEVVRIKTIQHWRGLRMFHCHILEHEEKGMMGQVEVV